MTRFLVSDDNASGYRLEEILSVLRTEVVKRCEKISDDHREEAHQVLENNIKVLGLLTEAMRLAENSTQILDRSFGRSAASEGGEPRIGRE